jgi:hypothetical protein
MWSRIEAMVSDGVYQPNVIAAQIGFYAPAKSKVFAEDCCLANLTLRPERA